LNLKKTIGYKVVATWLESQGFKPFSFQQEAWQAIHENKSGLVNAPTGFGKTFSIFLGAVIQFINEHPDKYLQKKKNGLQLIWITPLRALGKDLGRAMEEAIAGLGLQWQVGIRNGDTTTNERQKQKRIAPEVLIITPESLHLLLAQKEYPSYFEKTRIIAVDEWHELLGTKRGVQIELAISRLAGIKKTHPVQLWGISATIGNLDEAAEVLLFPVFRFTEGRYSLVRANLDKKIEIESILPDEIEKYPWAGHLGIKLVDKILPIIEKSQTTLIFINTRGMSERWYQALLQAAPELAGAIALHHGSIEQALRIWVEEALHQAKLKAVICTSSLDLGVDFRPVETVIQVGSPKGVARFLQRAGRSGHTPGAVSKIYFLPTHSLELIEAAALKQAIKEQTIESREPMLLCYDVLVQFLGTLAISEGFQRDSTYHEIKNTFCFQSLSLEEFDEVVQFLTQGGVALQQYDDYKKVELTDGVYRMTNRRLMMRHRLHIGTIVSDAMLNVKFISGGYIGMIEEWFISRLNPGDSFTLAGRQLELVRIKDMTVLVRKSTSGKSIVPSWNGGRLPLSAKLGKVLRRKFQEAAALIHKEIKSSQTDIEIKVLAPLFTLQQQLSIVPKENELLIEQIETKDGFHLFVYPFEGRLVHEAMAAILAYRIGKITPITFSFAMNDYGFELLSDQPIPVDDTNVYELFSDENLVLDIQRSVNASEMAKRKFRDIAVIGGLVFQGMPGEHKKARHLQSSASLLFNVFAEYDPDNVLIRQAYAEVFDQQMEETRLRNMLERIQQSDIVITFPKRLTPFCFPIKVDSFRENMSSEQLEQRVKRMQEQLNQAASGKKKK
jgi:ATP-dependent Lhr-like helicase